MTYSHVKYKIVKTTNEKSQNGDYRRNSTRDKIRQCELTKSTSDGDRVDLKLSYDNRCDSGTQNEPIS